jgi:hypothetical protein
MLDSFIPFSMPVYPGALTVQGSEKLDHFDQLEITIDGRIQA